jgi:hypothetical protein
MSLVTPPSSNGWNIPLSRAWAEELDNLNFELKSVNSYYESLSQSWANRIILR